jgi:hypothetical protein
LGSFFCHLHKVQHFRNWFPNEIDAGSSMQWTRRDHNAWFWRRRRIQSLCFWKANCETFVVRRFSCLFNSL